VRRIVIVMLSTITAVVLLFSYHTSTNSSTNAGRAPARPKEVSGSESATFTGAVADTRWGPVQVRVTVQGGKITSSEAVQYPQENSRDKEINDYALPILGKEAVQQQSATIDSVSGATMTSDGYQQSLQSAIDKAHL
jgi:uncharacterized protein with FMN-binding domain